MTDCMDKSDRYMYIDQRISDMLTSKRHVKPCITYLFVSSLPGLIYVHIQVVLSYILIKVSHLSWSFSRIHRKRAETSRRGRKIDFYEKTK